MTFPFISPIFLFLLVISLNQRPHSLWFYLTLNPKADKQPCLNRHTRASGREPSKRQFPLKWEKRQQASPPTYFLLLRLTLHDWSSTGQWPLKVCHAPSLWDLQRHVAARSTPPVSEPCLSPLHSLPPAFESQPRNHPVSTQIAKEQRQILCESRQHSPKDSRGRKQGLWPYHWLYGGPGQAP